MLLYNHSCVAHILFTLYCRLKETMNNTKTRCILDTKIATEALVYSYLLFQFLYAQNVSCRFLLMTCSPYKSPFRSDFQACTSHFGIYLHGFAYICGCLSPSFLFNSDVDVFMRKTTFLYSTRISV